MSQFRYFGVTVDFEYLECRNQQMDSLGETRRKHFDSTEERTA
jgi:hypothetical protein